MEGHPWRGEDRTDARPAAREAGIERFGVMIP
jgi:hypothetical protein